jgi:hypothetical protein
VLEDAALIARSVEGRRHVFTLRRDRVRQAEAWLSRHLRFWERSFDQLDDVLDELQQNEGRK